MKVLDPDNKKKIKDKKIKQKEDSKVSEEVTTPPLTKEDEEEESSSGEMEFQEDNEVADTNVVDISIKLND